MFDQLIGLLLLGIGVNKGIYAPNPNVKGDETVATATAKPRVNKSFRLNSKDFETNQTHIGGKVGSVSGIRRFDTHAFGIGVLHMQEDFAGEVEASREAAKKDFEANKIRFKQELALIKDAHKQEVVDKLNTNCQDINQKRTAKMTEMLSKLSTILANVTNRIASVSASGKDTSAADTAVATAQTAIADAQAAVAAQAGTTCTITITTETNLKTDVGKTISALQQDLKSVYEKVVAARKTVGDAIKALALVTGESP